MSGQDVNELNTEFIQLFKDIGVNVIKFNVKHLQGTYFLIEWDTKKGSYELPFECKNTYTAYGYGVWSSTCYGIKHKIRMFIFESIFSIIGSMANNDDTEAVGLLFEGLCAFWDSMFLQVIKPVSYRSVDSNKGLTDFIYGDSIVPRPIFKNPLFFAHFVTGSIGNKLYYHRKLGERSEMQERLKGAIY
jgi:hypothetical protein